jgi:hypothetical protein
MPQHLAYLSFGFSSFCVVLTVILTVGKVLIRIRIRICGPVPLDYGCGSGSSFFASVANGFQDANEVFLTYRSYIFVSLKDNKLF